ncbi:MAG: hypothetical protein V1787_00175 [Candidatus Micrarchaeota archaeon]
MDFILFECNLEGASAREELKEGFSAQQALQAIDNARVAVKRALYNYAPVDLEGIQSLAQQHSAGVKDIKSLAAAIASTKPSQLEAMLQPVTKDGRPQEYLALKKCDSAVHVAISCYISQLYEKIYPLPPVRSAGKPAAEGFKIAASYGKWVLVRKSSQASEAKETFAALAATAETLDRKAAEMREGGPESVQRLNAFLEARPSRRSLGKIPKMLEELESTGLLDGMPGGLEEYAVAKTLSHCGYAPYCSIELVNGVYPELKIPKPRGRMKKG